MTVQHFAILCGVFAAGLFLGSNLGVMLMCLLQMTNKREEHYDETV